MYDGSIPIITIQKDEEGVLDDDIYAELEAQRDALLNLQKKYTGNRK